MQEAPRIVVNVPLGTPLAEIIREIVQQTVNLCGGNKARAARRLDVAVDTVMRRIEKKLPDETLRGNE